MDGIRGVTSGVQCCVDARLVRASTPAGLAAVEPSGLWCGLRAFRLQHRLVVHDQYELAGIRRRIHHELSHADGWPRVSQLRLGRGRHRARGCLHPRHRSTRAGDDRQLLGGHDEVAPLDSVARVCRGRSGLRVARGRAEPQALRRCVSCRGNRHTNHRAGSSRLAGGDQAVRHQWRRLLQCQQCAPVRESDTGDELPRDVPDLPHSSGPDVDARRHDRLTSTWLGGLGGHGLPLRGRASA